ncbi:ankyrin repeat-containing domain protein [Mycena latifolia]|nr:ankyrin repeat-containing domain protein [Mycena latifolia]
MADIVGLIASVLQLVDTAVSIHRYIKDFRDAPKDQQRLLLEIQSLEPLVKELDNRIKKNQATGLTSGLQEFGEPLIQLKGIMERLTKKLDSTGISKVSNRVVWPLWGKEDIEEGLNSIERFKSLLNAWLGMDIWKSGQDITSSIQDFTEEQRTDHSYIMRSVKDLAQENRVALNKTMSTLKDAAEEQKIEHIYIAKSIRDVARNQEQYHDSDQRQKILDWYSPLNFFLRQADIFSAWQPGTGGWLLEADLFREWKSGSGKILWCRGIPGAGKTVLASIVVENLRTEQNTGVALLYLNHKETETPSILLAALWRQLVFGKPLPPAVHHLYTKHHEQRTRPSLEDTYSILCSIVSAHPSIFIVVDAIDEYPEELRNILLTHLSALGPTVNLMLTSRPHIKIEHILVNSALETLEIRATADDIRRYIAGQILKSPRLSKHVKNCPALREEIEATIVRRSDGMFLLAKFHIDSLKAKHTVKVVRDTLVNMPGDLNRTYDDIMQRIDRQSEDDRDLARRTLSWISNVKRPLRPAELREALAVEPGHTKPDPYNLLDIELILSICAGLVIVDEADDLVRLIHYTTQDYLVRVQADAFPRAQTEIASVCITYLFWRNDNHLLPKSFLDYSVDYGLMHARGQPESDIRDLIVSFLKNCSSWRILWNWRHGLEKIHPFATPLFIAAVFHLEHICRYLIKEVGTGRLLQEASLEGLTNVVRILVENGANADANEGEYDNPLQAASVHGHDEIIALLLSHDAHVDLRGQYGTALQVAAFFGHMESVRLLIRAGANIDAEGGRYGTALYAAAIQGNKEALSLLLEHGATVDRKGGHYGTALSAAVYRNDDGIAHILIQNGANVDAETAIYGSVLQRAAFMGYKVMVQLLIEHGANVNAEGGWLGSALGAASSAGQKCIASLLIEHGADINLRGGEYGRALQEASRAGHKDIVSMLIEHGADVNARGGRNRSTLEAASSAGHKDIVGLLIEHGADVNGGQYGSALEAASSAGHKDIVSLLIEHGADVNGGQYGALEAASSAGYKDIVSLLIKHGADVNGGQYNSALEASSSAGHKDIVSLLIENGADVNLRGGEYGRALQEASRAGHKDIVSMLIEHGADVNARGGLNRSALEAASSAGHKDIVSLLIERGADVNGGQYGALEAASSAGHKDIVSLLIEHGADVNGGQYGGALEAASLAGHKDIVSLLIEHGPGVNGGQYGGALEAASSAGRQDIVSLLTEHGADVNEEGGRALYAASRAGQKEIVSLLIEHGADVNAQNGWNGSALEAASSAGQKDIVSMLIEHGADVNARGGRNRSALEAASSAGHKDIVRLLIGHGADVNAHSGRRYDSALQAASSAGHKDIVNLLTSTVPLSISRREGCRAL